MSAPKTEVWSVGVCLYDYVTALDFAGPVELLGFLTPKRIAQKVAPLHKNGTTLFTKVAFEIDYLSVSLNPVVPDSGPRLVPTQLYSTEKQYDILLVPGGSGGHPKGVPKELLEFLKRQAPKARYVLAVCTGSWVLAATGLLDGKRATTAKDSFIETKETTSKAIEWVPKARWVVDGNYWTSSGVTAGANMAYAFLVHIEGKEVAEALRGAIELSLKDADDDEFAEFFGLV